MRGIAVPPTRNPHPNPSGLPARARAERFFASRFDGNARGPSARISARISARGAAVWLGLALVGMVGAAGCGSGGASGAGAAPIGPAADGGSSGVDAGLCSAPSRTCGGVCVSPATDVANCGDCGAVCTKSQTCADGRCVPSQVAGCADVNLGGALGDAAYAGTTAGRASRRTGVCLRSGTNPDILLAWRAPSAGRFRFTVHGQGWDPVIGAESLLIPGACQGSSLGCDDDTGGPNAASMQLEVVAGQEVLLVIDAFRTSGSGAFTLDINREAGTTAATTVCSAPTDVEQLRTGMPQQTLWYCAFEKCATNATPEACVSGCLTQNLIRPLASACAACLAGYGGCLVTSCASSCVPNTGAPACTACEAASCSAKMALCTDKR